MSEFSKHLEGVLVQWSMGLLLSLNTSYDKGWKGDPSVSSPVGNFMKNINEQKGQPNNNKRHAWFLSDD